MTTAVFILQLVTLALALVIGYIWQRGLFILNPARVADAIASQLLDDYKQELYILNESGTREYVRERYMLLATSWGLPIEALNEVEVQTWQRVSMAIQGEKPEPFPRQEASPFYG